MALVYAPSVGDQLARSTLGYKEKTDCYNSQSVTTLSTKLMGSFMETEICLPRLASPHEIVVPPLKWAGGKRWFAANYAHLLPDRYDRYIEPFLGSAALFFSAQPSKAVLSDVNKELINLYEVIRDQPSELYRKMLMHQRKHSADYYYQMRSLKPRAALSMAARTLYLNRTCWNGLYRVNLRGEFNVPKGTKEKVILDSDNFEMLSDALQSARIECQDFEATIDIAMKDDFLFIDPPYTVAHNNNGFVKYNQNLFSWEDQIRLRDSAKRAAKRGAKVLVTNAAHSSVKKLYEDFEQIVVGRAGIIAGNASSRGRYEELVARLY